MIEFLVIISCVAHIKSCPIPNGYNAHLHAVSKEQCERKARRIARPYASLMGFAAADFTIECKL